MSSGILTRLTKPLGILSLFLVIYGCSDSTEPLITLVDAPGSINPREVPSVTVGHGPEPGEAEVSWWIVNWATYPIAEYQVAFSYQGPITSANWNEAGILGTFPHRKGQVFFREIFGESEGLVQGSAIWIAVRALDTEGNLSGLIESPRLTLTTAWWIEGRVLDLRGNPIRGAKVKSPHTGYTDLTGPSGTYRLGPFRSIDTIELVVDGATPDGSWYGLNGKPIRSRPGRALVSEQDFFLIKRHGLDSSCILSDHEFLTYLRDMTFTSFGNSYSSTSILHRWIHYPLTVFIPAQVNDAGVRMDEAALAALLIWNAAMGEEYFVRTDEQSGADLEFRFEEMVNFYGLISLALPEGPDMDLGLVIPEKMIVTINPVLPEFQTVAEISLHELGHTLGLFNHADCGAPGYLMKIAGGFGSLDREEPIHPDERRAVEAIRYLPQGQDMNMYWIDEASGP